MVYVFDHTSQILYVIPILTKFWLYGMCRTIHWHFLSLTKWFFTLIFSLNFSVGSSRIHLMFGEEAKIQSRLIQFVQSSIQPRLFFIPILLIALAQYCHQICRELTISKIVLDFEAEQSNEIHDPWHKFLSITCILFYFSIGKHSIYIHIFVSIKILSLLLLFEGKNLDFCYSMSLNWLCLSFFSISARDIWLKLTIEKDLCSKDDDTYNTVNNNSTKIETDVWWSAVDRFHFLIPKLPMCDVWCVRFSKLILFMNCFFMQIDIFKWFHLRIFSPIIFVKKKKNRIKY